MTAQRMMFLTVAIMQSVGIWLTGYTTVHWILYFPLVAATFAGITGICPSLILYRKLGLK